MIERLKDSMGMAPTVWQMDARHHQTNNGSCYRALRMRGVNSLGITQKPIATRKSKSKSWKRCFRSFLEYMTAIHSRTSKTINNASAIAQNSIFPQKIESATHRPFQPYPFKAPSFLDLQNPYFRFAGTGFSGESVIREQKSAWNWDLKLGISQDKNTGKRRIY